MIDLIAIIPFDNFIDLNGGNGLIRVARIGKLYKLIKITRLIRLLKIIKQKGKTFKKMGNVLRLSAGTERIFGFLSCFFIVCHIMACIWIFSADFSVSTTLKKDENGDM